ncbi:FAD-binding protein [Streptomyces albofaciens JCM 4342]|uniref:FAD-dependent monooxygenase n=1 Tax=Streptomyces albofaciens TaxID=66866 RepID=UPI001238A929|nr:FAD-dependent monooxygenase [Streptomyces albofaciens]KAA6223372.1 FAD-binding protein [Streptomyces albofaciens JCM 4342]
MRQRTAIVIGGGIGGLTAAVALHRQGWEVTVLERAAALEPVGAGIALAANAQRALDTIDVGDAVRGMAVPQFRGEIRTPRGRRLARTDNGAAVRRFGGPVVVTHRAELIALLAGRLPEGAVRTGAPAEVVDPGDPARPDHPARVRLPAPAGSARPSHLTADLVVAADGIHSAARRALFPGHPEPRYAGFTSWRLVVPALRRPYAAHETWGPGGLWGSVALHDGRVYAYATAAVPPGGRAPDDERSELLRRFGGWHRPIPEILAAADPAAVLRNDVRTAARPLPACHRGRVALLGDAVHPMTPNLGQGGCQAIEDAVVLAHRVASDRPLAAALDAYSRERLPRTTEVVRRAERVGRLTTWRSAPAVLLRGAAIACTARLAPDLALRPLDGIADWRPPGGTYASGAPGARPAHPAR